jgi:hypothetical protein
MKASPLKQESIKVEIDSIGNFKLKNKCLITNLIIVICHKYVIVQPHFELAEFSEISPYSIITVKRKKVMLRTPSHLQVATRCQSFSKLINNFKTD